MLIFFIAHLIPIQKYIGNTFIKNRNDVFYYRSKQQNANILMAQTL